MYVCDEANIETHGFQPMGRLSHDPGWENTYVSRITRLVQRDRNHACVIFWSLGNESGRGCNLWKARDELLKLDSSRPVCYEGGGLVYEGTGITELTDIICPMYPNVSFFISCWQLGMNNVLLARADSATIPHCCDFSGRENGQLYEKKERQSPNHSL